MAVVRCGVVEYLNALPLWLALRGDPRFQVTPGVPGKISAMLEAGQIDIGLLPSIEYFRNREYLVVPGGCVSSFGAVESVRLFIKKPITDLRTVRLDQNSRTSAAMVQVILGEFYRIYPQYTTGPCDPTKLDSIPEDGMLVIGDPALRAFHTTKTESLDLGKEWTRFTGLPFVYAVWLARRSKAGALPIPDQELIQAITDAAEKGRQSLPQIIKYGAQQTGVRDVDVEIYLRSRIKYRLGGEQLEGLHYFAVKAAELGLCQLRSLRPLGQE